jgi:hypothetical protein
MDEDAETIAKLLKGRTMSVYAILLSQGPMGVREVQRALNFSSPSLALHHLTKLSELELVTKDVRGTYEVTRTVRVGSLSLFLRIGTYLLPRYLFLVSFVGIMLAIYLLVFASWPLIGPDIMFILLAVILVVTLAYESRRIWLLKPF